MKLAAIGDDSSNPIAIIPVMSRRQVISIHPELQWRCYEIAPKLINHIFHDII